MFDEIVNHAEQRIEQKVLIPVKALLMQHVGELITVQRKQEITDEVITILNKFFYCF